MNCFQMSWGAHTRRIGSRAFSSRQPSRMHDDDLNAPGALAAVDRWAADAKQHAGAGSPMDQALVSDAVNALLGVEL